ncbi:Na+/H+ antiporter subunit E [Halarchaeum sp. P4]|uniref:Na+/H+ antiporter subunit E n=1 Tax=Halarchaeum sp. P4 TaxID=3421639 RepID=UPI003EBB0A77
MTDAPPGGRIALRHDGGWRRAGAVFAVSLSLYLAFGGFAGVYDVATGVVSAAVTAVLLRRVALRNGVSWQTLRRLGRTVAFLPVLCWEILKANVALAGVVLSPSLPISPRVLDVEVDTEDDVERAFFANCVTLTPGTVILDVRGDDYYVHALTEAAASDLEDGRLARRVHRIFTSKAPEEGGRA